MPSTSGAAVKPDPRMWRRKAWIVGVHGPTGRLTVASIRTTPVVDLPPPSRCSILTLALQRVLDELRERRSDAGDRREVVERCLTHPADRAEFPQQGALLGRTDAGHVVEDRPDRALRPHV